MYSLSVWTLTKPTQRYVPSPAKYATEDSKPGCCRLYYSCVNGGGYHLAITVRCGTSRPSEVANHFSPPSAMDSHKGWASRSSFLVPLLLQQKRICAGHLLLVPWILLHSWGFLHSSGNLIVPVKDTAHLRLIFLTTSQDSSH